MRGLRVKVRAAVPLGVPAQEQAQSFCSLPGISHYDKLQDFKGAGICSF